MARASEGGYDDIPYGELSFETVDWTHRGEYIRTRSQRKGRPEFDVKPEWANEAVLDDPNAVVTPTPGSKSGDTITVIGHSSAAGRLLAVILLAKKTPAGGDW
ncbi:MAG: hypothetical protein GEU94_15370 [Micromonosporaceae bacterium]|nr:hypothetical protein [Micromonosporaceae bacterium]